MREFIFPNIDLDIDPQTMVITVCVDRNKYLVAVPQGWRDLYLELTRTVSPKDAYNMVLALAAEAGE